MRNRLKNAGLVIIVLSMLVAMVGCQSSYVRSAKIYLQQDDPKNAKEVLMTGAELTPEDPNVWYYLGKVHFDLKEWEPMLKAFDKAIELGSPLLKDMQDTRYEAWRINYNSGLKPFKKALDLLKAEDDKATGTLEKALVKFNMALIIDPENHQTAKAISECYLQLKDDENGEKYLKMSIELDVDKTDISSRVNLVNMFFSAERYEETIAMIEEIMVLDPSRTDLIGRVAISYQNMNDNDKAIEAWDRVIERDPENADFHFNRGMLLYNMAVDDSTKLLGAAISFAESYKLNPEDSEARDWLTNALLRTQQWEKLIATLEPFLFNGEEISEDIVNPVGSSNTWQILAAAYSNVERYEDAAVCVKVMKKLEE